MSNLSETSNPAANRGRFLLGTPPLIPLSLSFALGIWMVQHFSFSFVLVAFAVCIFLSILVILAERAIFLPLSMVLFSMIGILFGTNDQVYSEREIAQATPLKRMILEGEVIAVPEVTAKGRKETVSFVFQARQFYRNGGRHEVQGKVQVFLHNPGREIHFGDRLKLRGMLEAPREIRNPHAFDYRAYLARQGIGRIFRGIGKYSVLKQSQGNQNSPMWILNRFRATLRNRLERLFPSPYQELANALVLGFRKNVSRDIQDAFIQTGTAHLLAISGMNISLIAGLFYFVAQMAGFPRIFNLILTTLFVGIYTVLAGANIPVLRAGVMGILIFLGLAIGEERNLKSAFFFAFFVLLAFDPSVLFLASFQLSFLAMASLIFILPSLEKIFLKEEIFEFIPSPFLLALFRIRRFILQTLLASVAVTIGMFPVLIGYFNLFSLVGFVANLFAIPVCTVAIALTLPVLIVDFISSGLASCLSYLPLLFFRTELWFIHFFAKIPIGYFYIPTPPWYYFFLYYGFLFVWFSFLSQSVKRSWRVWTPVLFVFLSFWIIGRSSSSFRVTFFDLGRAGHAAFVSFSNGANCLINAGRHFPNNQAYWILRPFLMAEGIQKVDSLLLTQVNASSAGGLETLAQYFRIQKLWYPNATEHTPQWLKYIPRRMIRKGTFQSLRAGDRIEFGGDPNIYLEILRISKNRVEAFKIQDHGDCILYLLSQVSSVSSDPLNSVCRVMFQANQSSFPHVTIGSDRLSLEKTGAVTAHSSKKNIYWQSVLTQATSSTSG